MATDGTGSKSPRASVSSDPVFQAMRDTLAQVVEQLRRVTEAQIAAAARQPVPGTTPPGTMGDQMDTDPDHRRSLFRPKIELPKFDADSVPSAKSFVRVARPLRACTMTTRT
jgi:hypothetical protein